MSARTKQKGVCDYLSARLVLTESVVPETHELHVDLPFEEDGLVSFAVRDCCAADSEDNEAEIQLNPKQVRSLVSFLLSWMQAAKS